MIDIDPRPPLANQNIIDKDNPMDNGQHEEAKLLLRRNSVQNLFNGYEFDVEQLRHQLMQDKKK